LVRVSVLNPGAVRTEFFQELDFEPGPDPENAIEPEDVAALIMTILEARQGTVIDEINLSPQKQVWRKKK
jgi:NADP-dependent 3-hydroxy acid dehydrogenase YdfG